MTLEEAIVRLHHQGHDYVEMRAELLSVLRAVDNLLSDAADAIEIDAMNTAMRRIKCAQEMIQEKL